MNAVEIEEAISNLAAAPFAPEEFAFAFLQAFGNKPTTLKRLRKGTSNRSDLGGVLQSNNIHIKAASAGFRGDAEAVLSPEDEAKFESVTYTYYEQLNGYQYLKTLDIGYFFYSGSYADDILKVFDPNEKTILHIPNVNSRESTKDKHREVEHIIDALGDWQGTDPQTGFQCVKTPEGRVLKIADLVDDESAKRDCVSAALKDPAHKDNRDHVDIIIEGQFFILGGQTGYVAEVGKTIKAPNGESDARLRVIYPR